MERGQMLLGAGHAANACEDLTQAAQILTILVNQGRQELSRKLSQVAVARASAFILQQQYPSALEDLNVSIQILLSLASSDVSADFLAELAKALQQRAKLYSIGQAVESASDDYSKAIQLFRTLVETHGRSEFSSDLAECLLSNLALSGDPTEPENQAMLVQAIQLVIGKTREGKNPPDGFVVDSLKTLQKAVTNDPSSIRSELAEVVLKLVEHAAQMPKGHLDWVQATETMQQISELLNPRTEPRYLHLIILCCLTTNKEVSVHGEASLLRVIFYLRRLAEVIEMHSRTPDCVGGVGQAFNVIIEYGKFFNQDHNRAQAAEMVNLWRKLQPSLPAAANIPRQLLASLARSL
jgi:tetratricopeptide (TPR) repeat protein